MIQQNWTQIGAREGFDRAAIEHAIASLVWQKLPITTGMMQGLGIKGAIKELRIPNVSHVAESNQLAPFGFYGIRAHYENGDADIYIVDRGSDLVPVRSDFTPAVDVRCTKRAVIYCDGEPHINCGCGERVLLTPEPITCAKCGTIYDSRGWIQNQAVRQ